MIKYNIRLNGQAIKKTIQEPAENFKNVDKKVKEYYKRAGQVKGKVRN